MAGIPTAHDYRIAELDQIATSIVAQVSILHRAGPADQDRMRLLLRQRVQDFADAVFAAADQAGI